MNCRIVIAALFALGTLGGCAEVSEPAQGQGDQAGGEEDANLAHEQETISILRTDIEQPDAPESSPEELATLIVTLGFPQGGSELDAAALLGLQEVLASPQIALGGPIVLRGHSDSAGSGEANLRSSQARAERVRDWLTENGVARGRIRIIAFGEQNPAEPNALPDGMPNEAGRAANRRVEIEIAPPVESYSNPPPSAQGD